MGICESQQSLLELNLDDAKAMQRNAGPSKAKQGRATAKSQGHSQEPGQSQGARAQGDAQRTPGNPRDPREHSGGVDRQAGTDRQTDNESVCQRRESERPMLMSFLQSSPGMEGGQAYKKAAPPGWRGQRQEA